MRRAVGRSHGRTLAMLALLSCASAPARLCAQTPDSLAIPRVSPTVHYGKWLALAGAAGGAVLAEQRHQDANRAFETLRGRCDATPSGCVLVGGQYVDPVNEALYQDTRRLDHQAARYLTGAEVLFAASAAGFVWELMHRHSEPKNIPFAPRVERVDERTEVGVSVRF